MPHDAISFVVNTIIGSWSRHIPNILTLLWQLVDIIIIKPVKNNVSGQQEGWMLEMGWTGGTTTSHENIDGGMGSESM